MIRRLLAHKNTRYILTLIVIAFVITFSGFVISITEASPIDQSRYTDERLNTKLALDYTVVPPPPIADAPAAPRSATDIVVAMQGEIKPLPPSEHQTVTQQASEPPENPLPTEPIPDLPEIENDIPEPEEQGPEEGDTDGPPTVPGPVGNAGDIPDTTPPEDENDEDNNENENDEDGNTNPATPWQETARRSFRWWSWNRNNS